LQNPEVDISDIVLEENEKADGSIIEDMGIDMEAIMK
jgi:hypothetical protein